MLVYRGFDTHCLMIAQISPLTNSPHSPLEHVVTASVFLVQTGAQGQGIEVLSVCVRVLK